MVGQEHVTTVLSASIKNKTFAHAYLFAGSRGTGKTSIARIFAEALGSSWKDIYEIDAASNRGIDEIRELRDGVWSLPFESEHKIYIIDEVHMLTKEAFNALLKTLEEPPSHVVFILATTELHKVPETIVSRCQTFTFKKPTEEELGKTLARIAKEEGRVLDKESLALVALTGDGSFRDAIGSLQKVFSLGKEKITLEDVEQVTGAPRLSIVTSLLEAFAEENLEKTLTCLEKAGEGRADMKVFTKLLMRELRFAMLLLFAPELRSRIKEEMGTEELDLLESIGKKPGAKLLPALLKELLSAYQDIDRAYIKALPIELAFIKVLRHDK